MDDKPSDKTLFAMDLTTMMAVEQISEETNQPQEKVLLDFMESDTAKILYDDSTKLWWDGPSATAEEYKKQLPHHQN